MTRTLVAIDLDGTLLNSKHQITYRTEQIIRKLQKQGYLFTLASGRPFLSILPYAKQLEISLPLITANGSLLRTTNLETVFKNGIPCELAQKVIDFGVKTDLAISIYYEAEVVTFDDKLIKMHDDLEGLDAYLSDEWSVKESPLKILYTGIPSIINEILTPCQNMFGADLYLTQSEEYFLEFMNIGVSKGEALKMVIEQMTASVVKVFAIGNNFNDLSMFDLADFSIAMANSPQRVKDLADYVTDSNDNDGVARFLEILDNRTLKK